MNVDCLACDHSPVVQLSRPPPTIEQVFLQQACLGKRRNEIRAVHTRTGRSMQFIAFVAHNTQRHGDHCHSLNSLALGHRLHPRDRGNHPSLHKTFLLHLDWSQHGTGAPAELQQGKRLVSAELEACLVYIYMGVGWGEEHETVYRTYFQIIQVTD